MRSVILSSKSSSKYLTFDDSMKNILMKKGEDLFILLK